MHTEKNVAVSLFHTILNIPDKTKDNVKARTDQQRICDRPRLNMKPPTGGRKNWFKPDADFVLKPPEKGSNYLAETNFEVHRWLCIEYK